MGFHGNKYTKHPVEATKRFWAKVNTEGQCWVWLGARNQNGYGRFWHDVKMVTAHRFAYEEAHGPVVSGLVLDHLCRNRSCVRPGHLEPVSGHENTLRGESRAAANARRTHCSKGHDYLTSGYVDRRGQRNCNICRNAKNRAYRLSKRSKQPV